MVSVQRVTPENFLWHHNGKSWPNAKCLILELVQGWYHISVEKLKELQHPGAQECSLCNMHIEKIDMKEICAVEVGNLHTPFMYWDALQCIIQVPSLNSLVITEYNKPATLVIFQANADKIFYYILLQENFCPIKHPPCVVKFTVFFKTSQAAAQSAK